MSKRIIWVGLDVHADTIAVARLDGETATPVTSEIPNDPKIVRRLFQRLLAEGELRVCYEAGPCGYELFRQLHAMRVGCIVVAPSLVPRKPGERIKTDRRDAVKLVRLLRAGELTAVCVPDEDQEALRDLLRAREDARRDRTAARHRLGKFLLRHGRHYTAGSGWTQRHWKWIGEQRFERPCERLVFEQYIEQVRQLDARLAVFDEEIARLSQTELLRERVARLCTLRGISTLTAMVLVAELFDVRRFTHPRQLMAYLGLVPSESSSGSSIRRGRITKTGNVHVRRVLVEASWAFRHKPSVTTRQHLALAKQPPEVARIAREATARLSRRYGRLVGRGKRQQVAVTAIARELCGFIWALETLPAAA